MLCCPFFVDQQTNCRYACNEWGIGMEIDNDINRENVKTLVRELMEGEKGKKMKKGAMEWKKLAVEATTPNGTSSMNLDKLINEVLLSLSHRSSLSHGFQFGCWCYVSIDLALLN